MTRIPLVIPQLTKQELARFWKKVERGPVSACWPWQGYCGPKGHGQFWIREKLFYAHRVAWTIANGPIPPGLCVCHRCDNGRCVNASHLFLGTRAENIADCKAKGRQAQSARHSSRTHPERVVRGESHWASKLTETDVREMRNLYLTSHVTMSMLARQYGISRSTVADVIHRRCWKQVR